MVIYKFRNLKTGQAMPIPPGEFKVGRNDDAYVHVEDVSVSRQHAKIINLEEGLFVEDLSSSNGTAIKGVLLTGRKLVEIGDVVHIGSVPFRVDPEVGGEPTVAVAKGARPVNRDYVRRDTERLTAKEMGLAVEAALAEKPAPAQTASIAMPEVVKPKPEAEPVKVAVPVSEPTMEPESESESEDEAKVRHRSATKDGWWKNQAAKVPPSRTGTAPKATTPPPAGAPTTAVFPQKEETEKVTSPTKVAAPVAVPAGSGKGLLIMTFLGGIGVGLVLGFCLAKLL